MDYLLAQSLSLVFYFITLIVYNRARKEYVGGKIAAAIKLIMVFMVILLFADFVDYFFVLFLPLAQDTILIFKIILKLIAICVLFFGGVKFFARKPISTGPVQQAVLLDEIDVESAQPFTARPEPSSDSTVVLEDIPHAKPTLGRYEILEQIGKGAMGIVYKGRDPKLQRLTAIKTIRFTDEFDESQAEEIKEQFYREAEVVAKLSHPNIVTLYDVGEDLDLSYLAMEYLDGESLDQHTKADNLLPITKCIDIIIQVCDALEYAHKHGIVHRDIKPANIMLLEGSLVKVTDFGIARIAASSKTHTGIIKGTPYYMSPEQAKGLKVAGPSDIFSLGVVFYQLLTGKLPFSGENMAAIMYQTMSMDPEPPTTYNPMVNKATLTILNRCLEKNLQKRYQTAKQLGDQLRILIRNLAAETEAEAKDFYPDPEADHLFDETYPEEEADLDKDPDFTDLEPILELDDKIEEKFDADLEGLAQLPEADLFFDPAVSETDRKFENELDFSDSKQISATSEEVEVIDVTDREKPATLTWTTIQSEKDVGSGALSMLAKRIVFYGCLLLFISGIGCYYYWKSSHLEVSVIKKRRALPVDIDHIKTYVTQQKQKQKEPAKETVADNTAQAQQPQPAIIAKEKQARRERLANIEKERQAQRKRLADIEKEKQARRKRLANIEKEKKAVLRLEQTGEIDNLISKADNSFKEKKYQAAKNKYESALKFIEAGSFKAEESFIRYKREVEKALLSEGIVYGSKGFVKYRDKWLSPDEYENKLYQEGFVKYKGQFKKYTALNNIIKRLTYPRVYSFLKSKYSGQNVHKKQIEFHKLKLKQNSGTASYFNVSYKWEVWTFNEIGEGQCSLDLYYDVEHDKWTITKECE